MKLKSYLLFVLSLYAVSASAAQVCVDEYPETAPTHRFEIDSVNMTVIDLKTGLMWQLCEAGLSGAACEEGESVAVTWDSALQYPQTLNVSGGYAGYNDWRLPNINELSSLMERRCYLPSVNLDVFANTTSTWFWSASPYARNNSQAWSASFTTGVSRGSSRSVPFAVRLVR